MSPWRSPRMSQWRRLRVDVAIVLLAAAIAASALGMLGEGHRLASVAASVLSMLVFLARSRQPLTVSLLAFGALAVAGSFGTELTPLQFLGILAAFGLVGAINRPRDAVLGWLAGALGVAYAQSRSSAIVTASDFVLTITFCTITWSAGLAVAHRSQRVAAAEHRASEAERGRTEHARLATAAERARIATELHDIVSHGLSVVIVQTVAARQDLDDGADAAAGAVERRLGVVEETAREALSDMRRMLGLLQSTANDSVTAATDPSPGLANLPQLFERARATGLAVSVTGLQPAQLSELPPGLQLVVYRTLQEALTNVIRHAPTSDVAVRLQRNRSVLEVEVCNRSATAANGTVLPAVTTGAGRGLIGLHQRCAVYGGSLRAEPLASGGFQVLAQLPIDDAHAPERVDAMEGT